MILIIPPGTSYGRKNEPRLFSTLAFYLKPAE